VLHLGQFSEPLIWILRRAGFKNRRYCRCHTGSERRDRDLTINRTLQRLACCHVCRKLTENAAPSSSYPRKTKSSAVAEKPRDASCRQNFCLVTQDCSVFKVIRNDIDEYEVCKVLSYIVTDIFSIEYRRNLEIWVRGNSRSLKMVPFESFGQTDRQTDGQSCYINVARQYVLFAFHSSDNVYGTYRPDHVINQRRCDTNQPGSNSSPLTLRRHQRLRGTENMDQVWRESILCGCTIHMELSTGVSEKD